MTTETKRRVEFWGVLLAAVIAAGTIGAFVFRPVAQAEVQPVAEHVEAVDRRVTRLEEKSEAADRKTNEISNDIREMRGDIKELLRRVK